MKKVLFPLFAAMMAFTFTSLTSCNILGDEDLGKGYKIVKATRDANWTYNADNPIFEVDSDVKQVKISSIPAGKTLYLVKRNVGETPIESGDTRYATNKTGSRSIISETIPDLDSITPEKSYICAASKYHELPMKFKSSARSIMPAKPVYNVTPIDPTIDDEIDLYLCTARDSKGNEIYTLEEVKLYASDAHCRIWIANDCYDSSAKGKKVNEVIAENYKSAFEKMYELIRNVYGIESDKIYNADIDQFVDSYFGEKVNIVIYDIDGDYNKTKQYGVMGYFASKDYFYSESPSYSNSVISKSNAGKFFYIDSVYANSNYEETISTLAHEFQHMINFNEKTIKKDVTPSASYNEMLSMLCEDMIQEFLGFDDKYSPKERTSNFNAYYYHSGISEYRGDDSNYTPISYATAYCFGSWLARQYGGAALVQKIMQNNLADNDSLVAGVNNLNNKYFTYDDLFQQFLLALTGSTIYTHDKNADQTITFNAGPENKYSYPMTAYRLSSYSTSAIKDKFSKYAYSGYNWTGPVIISNQFAFPLRPNDGISIHGIEETSAGTDTIVFSEEGADTLVMYLIIQ